MKNTVVFLALLVIMVPFSWSQATTNCTLDDPLQAEQILYERGVTSAFENLFGEPNKREILSYGQVCLDFETLTSTKLNTRIIKTATAINAVGPGTPNSELQNTSSFDKALAGSFIRLVSKVGVGTLELTYPDDFIAGGKPVYPTLQEAIDDAAAQGAAGDMNVKLTVVEANPHTATTKGGGYVNGAYEGLILRTVNGASGVHLFELRFAYDQSRNLTNYGQTFTPIIDAAVNGSTFCLTADLGCNLSVSNVDLVNEGASSAVQFRFCNVWLDDISSSSQITTFIDIPDLVAGQVVDISNVWINGVSSGRGIWVHDADFDGSFIGDGLNISGVFSGAGIQTSCNTSVTNSNVSGNADLGIYILGDKDNCDSSLVDVHFDNVVVDGNSQFGFLLEFVQDDASQGEVMPSGASASIANSRIRSNGGTGIKIVACDNLNLWKTNIGVNNTGIYSEESTGDVAQCIITQNTTSVVTTTYSGLFCSVGTGGPVLNFGDNTWCGVNTMVDSTTSINNSMTTMLTAYGNWPGVSGWTTVGNVDLGTDLPNPPLSGAAGYIELTKNVDGVNIDVVDINWADAGNMWVYYDTDPANVSALSSGTAANGTMVDALYLHPLNPGVNEVLYLKRDEVTGFDPNSDPCPGGG